MNLKYVDGCEMMSREIVVPGEIVSKDRKRLGSNVFIQNGNIVSSVVGVKSDGPDMAGVVALKGKYIPISEDFVVGIVASEKHAGYIVEINSFNQAFLLKDEAVDQLKVGSVITAKVGRVNELKEADLYEARMIYGGEFVSVPCVKIPRVIGKNASMVNTIKELTHALLFVGRNGFIMVKGDDSDIAVEAIRFVEANSHQENLTNTVTEIFAKKMQEKYAKLGKPMPVAQPQNPMNSDSRSFEPRSSGSGNFEQRRFEPRNSEPRKFESRSFDQRPARRNFEPRNNFQQRNDRAPQQRSFEPRKFDNQSFEHKQAPEFEQKHFDQPTEKKEFETESKPKKRFGFF